MPSYGGKYKGTRFRSLLELSVMREAENDGFVLGVDVLYETVKVKYGKGRTYIVDFHFVSEQLIVEVKPSSRTKSSTFKRKCAAAMNYADEHGLTFVVITEKEIKDVLTLEEASKIDDIEWGVRAKRKMRAGRGKKRKSRRAS